MVRFAHRNLLLWSRLLRRRRRRRLLLRWVLIRSSLSESGREFRVRSRVRRGHGLRRVEPEPRRGGVGLSHWRAVLFEIGRPRGRTSGRLQGVEVGGSEVRVPAREALDSHHGVEIGVVEVRAPGRGVPGRAQAVNLGVGEVRRPRRHCRTPQGPPRSVRLPHRDVELPVVADLGVGLQEVPAVQRNDVGVDLEGDDGRRGLRKLLHDEHLSAAVLEEEEEEGVPDDTLEHHHLDHEGTIVVAVHGYQQGNAHDQSVGQGGDREDGDHPLQAPIPGEVGPDSEDDEHDDLLQRIGGDEPEVHGVGVVGGDEVEGEQRHGEDRDEAVYAGALVRREDPPPLDRAVGQDHRHVQRNHRRQDVVQVLPRDHLSSISCSVRRRFRLGFRSGGGGGRSMAFVCKFDWRTRANWAKEGKKPLAN